MQLPGNPLKNLIVVGDRVLIKPLKPEEKTSTGLFLPSGVEEKEKVRKGYILKAGPGYPIPMPVDEGEAWRGRDEQVKYIPLQAREGDLAIFLQNASTEIIYQGEKYFIVPQGAILMLEREDL